MTRALVLLVRCYQWTIAPALPPSCRFLPSCSSYMIEALETHGVIRGLRLGIGRLLRCHPGCKPGYDPVPRAPLRKGPPAGATPQGEN